MSHIRDSAVVKKYFVHRLLQATLPDVFLCSCRCPFFQHPPVDLLQSDAMTDIGPCTVHFEDKVSASMTKRHGLWVVFSDCHNDFTCLNFTKCTWIVIRMDRSILHVSKGSSFLPAHNVAISFAGPLVHLFFWGQRLSFVPNPQVM